MAFLGAEWGSSGTDILKFRKHYNLLGSYNLKRTCEKGLIYWKLHGIICYSI